MYTDDLFLMAASPLDIQALFDTASYAAVGVLRRTNTTKSCALAIGESAPSLPLVQRHRCHVPRLFASVMK